MATAVRLLLVPYDSARRGERMGRGPDALLAAGVVEQLRRHGTTVAVERVEADEAFPREITTAFDLACRVAAGVRSAVEAGQFPLVLAGNCFTAVGTLAGLGREPVGVAWFDCHGDFHTPETTASGFLDGMALATVAGRCWAGLAATISGFRPVPGRRVLHLGGRDFDPGEREALSAAGVVVSDAESLRRLGLSAVAGADWPGPVAGVYAHFDLDALDPSEGAVNGYQTPGGLSLAEAQGLLREVSRRAPLRAAALTAYDPSGDPQGRAAAAGICLIHCLAKLAA
jgi:arginase